jgi:hypothetical protein
MSLHQWSVGSRGVNVGSRSGVSVTFCKYVVFYVTVLEVPKSLKNGPESTPHATPHAYPTPF